MKNQNYSNTINAETIYQKADAIAIRAILTDWVQSGNDYMRLLYHSAVTFAKSNHVDDDGKNGADIIQDVAEYLWRYNGKSLTDTTGEIDKNGEPVTILRTAFRYVGSKIKNQRQKQYKHIYITDYENEHGEIAVPMEWDVDTFDDFQKITAIIDDLNLTANQYNVLGLRMRGMSYEKCANAKGCSKQNINKVLDQIRKKYIDVYGLPETVKV